MKLLKKLLPIATVASVAAVIAPMSSCANAGSGWIDGTQKLNTKNFKKCKTEDLPTDATLALATENYAEVINKNAQVVYDDFAWSLTTLNKLIGKLPLLAWSFGLEGFGVSYVNTHEFKGQISNLSVNTVKYTATYNAQYKMDLDIVIEIPVLAELDFDPQIVLNVNLDANIQYNDCPFIVTYDHVYSMLHMAEAMEEGEPEMKSVGLAFNLNESRLSVDSTWSIDMLASLDVQATNPDVELGIDLSTNGNYRFNANILTGLIAKEIMLYEIVAILGGWSTYYYSDFESEQAPF